MINMKKLFFTLLASIVFISVYGQAPQEINYQGVARNSGGTLLSNQNIGIKLDLHQGSAGGTVVFSEAHNKTTNVFGLFNLGIGSVNTSGFSSINWANGPYFLEVSMDPAGGTSYSSVGTQQFMSVPYALYAQTAGNASPTPTITINAPNTITSSAGSYTINVPAAVSYSAGTGIDITGGIISNTASATTPTINSGGVANVTNPSSNVYLVDVPAPVLNYNSGTNELTLTQNGATSTATLNGSGSNTISIVGSGLASVTPTTGNTFTVSVPNPTLSIGSGSLSISNGNSVAIPSPSLSINSNSLTINGPGGNTVLLPSASTTSLTQGTNITVTGSSPNYTVSAPAYSISLPGGNVAQITNGISTSTAAINATSLTLTGANNNILSAGGNTVGLNTYTAGTGITISGTAPNYTLASPNQSLSITGNSLSISGANTVTIPTSTVNGLGTGIATVTTSVNNFTVNVPAPTYTAANGVLGFGTNTIVVTPTLSLIGTTLTSGATTNSVNLSSINNWSVTSGVIYPSSLTNSVGVGTSGPLNDKMEIFHTSSPTSAHLHLNQIGGATSRIKFSNNSVANKFFETAAQTNATDIFGAYSIGFNDGVSNTKQILLINQQKNVFINNLNAPLAALHVMTHSTTPNGLAVEGFNKFGELIIARNNQIGLSGSRQPIVATNEIGRITFSGASSTVYPNEYTGGSSNISVRATDNFAPTTQGSEMYFQTVPTGTNVSKDVMKLTQDGSVEVTNMLRIPYGTIAAGKVLTSDNSGNASWQTITAPAAAWTSTLGTTTLVNSSDKVGIGTNTPFTIIHAKSDISFPYMLLETAVNHGGYISAHSGGTLASPTYNSNDVILGGFGLGGYDVTNFGPSANMSARTSEPWNSTSRGTALYFETTQNGQTGMTPRMKIDHNGYVGINSNAVSTFIPQSILHVETDGSLDKGLRVSNFNSTANGPSIYLDGQNQDWSITGSNAGNGSGANKFVIRDYSNAADRFVIDNTGNVGIGTTFPINKFHVNGSIAITDGTQGVGKVLVSDASGNGSWMPIMKITYGSASCQAIASVSTTPVKFNTNIGAVSKSYSDTHLEVILQTDLNVFDLVGANSVTYEIKVNGISANGNTGKAVYFVDNANALNIINNKGVTITAEFDGLTAGSYNVELWAYCLSGNALNVYIDPGCFGASSVIIKEFK